MKRWIHAYTAIEDDPFPLESTDPFYEDNSFKGWSLEDLHSQYEDYVDPNFYPTFEEWVRYLKKNGLYDGERKSRDFEVEEWITGSTDEDDDWEWTPFHGGVYRIDGEVGSGAKFSNNPAKAIEWWFKLQKKAPMDVAISCQKLEDAIRLVESGTPELITELASKYKTPYKPEYIIKECKKKVADGCRWFHEGEYGDTVHPFGVG